MPDPAPARSQRPVRSGAAIAEEGPRCYGGGMAENALETHFLAHRTALARFVRARCGHQADAEDILQDLWIKLGAVATPPDEPLSYLYRMADHLIIDRARSARRRERRDDAWNEMAIGGDPPSSAAPSPERAVMARNELARVAALFDSLGEPTTGIFKSYRIEGVPQREIAERYGLSLSAIEKHLQKAYKAVLQLRDEMDAEKDTPDRLITERTE